MTATKPPTPYGPTPTERQLKWHQIEVYGFIHFSINTFTDKEWGYGDESPSTFNPTAFDADQIVRATKNGGLKGLVLTCKHHDGFCLWPSPHTEHSVANSPWKDGKGDIVREFSEACARHDLKFGVYLSPWDRNRADYGTPQYLDYYRAQLRELLTGYGPIFEVWFDGANGGDGFYGGARETRNIDNETYYDWDNTWQIVRELQPDACIFTDKGPDIRWVGNESGFAADPCWSTLNTEGIWPGHADHGYLNRGDRNGAQWLPAEVDVSTRPGWFYHASEDDAVKSVAHLRQIYFESVGRGASLILNIPPDRRGLIHENDADSLLEWHQLLQGTFAVDLAQNAQVTASNTRGNDPQFAPAHVLDSSRDTYWATDDADTTAELILDLGQPTTFNVVRLREYLPLGQRVDTFALDAWNDEQWQEFAAAASIGNCRLLSTSDITTSKVRLRITQAAACPALSELVLFQMPKLMDAPKIERGRDGLVTIHGAESDLRYTLDGSKPTETSALYEEPFALLQGGTVKARAFSTRGQHSGIATANFEVSKRSWRIIAPESDAQAANLIDENPATFWISAPAALPQKIVVDMGETLTLKGFTFLPRQDGKLEGTPDRYEFYVSADGKDWGAPADIGEFSNIKANPILQTKTFDRAVTGKFFRFVAVHTIDNASHVSIAEIGVVTL
ncbi:alpha-L-fucosidase [Abditibacterium utsteinense]|uniref:alpha-L-fucosidase n=1 Tax=Abditibacterium utsteinense TaxID=1960156 RepID=A0A2S8SP98_9BACT|nr:alpha-L-fucosidase [Abditibacterium utsteinense]PQV62604.1 alpha-L-fucosidase [Abditibacterium utsteinense]